MHPARQPSRSPLPFAALRPREPGAGPPGTAARLVWKPAYPGISDGRVEMATRSEPPVRQAANQADPPTGAGNAAGADTVTAGADTAATASGAGSPPPVGPPGGPPAGLRVAAVAQAAEAVVLFVAAVFAAVATADGKSYERASGIALTLIAAGTAAGLGAFAVGLARARPWTRTPVVMTQLFIGGAGIYLVDGHRLEWAIPALALAVICLAGIFAPASLRALNRPPLNAPAPSPSPDPIPEAQPAKPAKASQNSKAQNSKAQGTQASRAQQSARTAKAQPNAKISQSAKRPPADRKRERRR